MIEASDFIEAARARGFGTYTGVPCSYLTPFINRVINDDTLRYVSAANEGDAVAIASGAAVGGQRAVAMMQNSGLGNAVSPLTSLNHVFRIPILLICTHRGAPGEADEPQHELMGRITTQLFDTMEIPWEPFPTQAADVDAVLGRALACMEREQRPYALVMAKGSVAPHALTRGGLGVSPGDGKLLEFNPAADDRPARSEVLRQVQAATGDGRTVLVASTGFTGRELYALDDRANQLYMVGSMGCASSFGLGLALARPDLRVVVLDGDGAALMRMGNLATIGAYKPDNLVHLLLDNEAHESTGAQSTVTAGTDFCHIAQACGYALCIRGTPAMALSAVLAGAHGPRFAHLKIRTGTLDGLPRPKVTPPQVLARLMGHIGSRF